MVFFPFSAIFFYPFFYLYSFLFIFLFIFLFTSLFFSLLPFLSRLFYPPLFSLSLSHFTYIYYKHVQFWQKRKNPPLLFLQKWPYINFLFFFKISFPFNILRSNHLSILCFFVVHILTWKVASGRQYTLLCPPGSVD